ncbi:MAG: RNA polymerase sigma factor [Spirochaetia bacterium]
MKTSGREFDSLAEDFVQETLMKVLENLDSFQGRSQFTTWAHKIAVRVALTELRRRRWKDVSLENLMEAGETPALAERQGSDPATRAAQSMSMETFSRIMIEELSEKQRTAITAVALKGMPLEEVARRLGTNRNALYKSIHDARLKLKRRLAREGMSVQELTRESG